MTAAFTVLATLHFANPYPLIQLPDRGHRLYAVPSDQHAIFVELFERAGLPPFGTFNVVVRQTLLADGFTVVASGPHLDKAAISIPTGDPRQAAEDAKEFLSQNNIAASIFYPLEGELQGKLVLLQLPADLGWDIAFRRPSWSMPWPEWE